MSKTKKTNLLIIGAGPAGYTAAIYAARANLKPTLIMGDQPGGQLMVTTDVENYPGFAETIQGPWLMDQMQAQAKHVGTDMIQDMISSVDFSNPTHFKAWGDSGTEYVARAVIIATGAQAKWLGLESENFFRGYGVSACATCDGFFFRGKDVAIVGGGNTAVEEALYLTNHANHVTLIHRRDFLRAEKILQDRLFGNSKITILWNKEVETIVGTETPHRHITELRLKDTQTGDLSSLSVNGLFVAIGHKPMTTIFENHLERDSEGYIKVEKGTTWTSQKGIFAAGDVADKIYRQAVTAAGLGCMAALDANRYLQEHGIF